MATESLQKQIREIKHHDLVLWGLITLAIAFIIWLLLRKHPIGNIRQGDTNVLNDTPVYSVGGNTYIIGRPQNGYPGSQYNLFPPNDQTMQPGPPCSCGCTSCSGGNTTFTFPDFTGIFDSTISALQAADLALINGMTSGLPYSERVFVTNNTPTAF